MYAIIILRLATFFLLLRDSEKTAYRAGGPKVREGERRGACVFLLSLALFYALHFRSINRKGEGKVLWAKGL